MPMEDNYTRGFADGLKWVSDALRRSALIVEQTEHADFARANGGPVFRAIAKLGQVHFAKQLREVAKTIDEAIEQTK